MELSLVCLIISVASVMSASVKRPDVNPTLLKTCDWLVKNNYCNIICEDVQDEKSMENDLRGPLSMFQQHRKIPETGVLDEITIKEMNEPHCGLPEITGTDNSKRIKRQVDMTGNPLRKVWGGPNFFMPLTLSIFNTWGKTDRISISKQQQIIWRASQMWAAASSSISFEWAPQGKRGNIEIMFAFIDGPHKAIAKAGDPAPNEVDQSTWLRIDDAEMWVETWAEAHLLTEYSLLWTMVHEMGHNLGLGHSNNTNDIMFSKIQRTPEKLSVGDIEAIQRLYGGNNHFPTPSTTRATTRQPDPIVPVNLQPANPPSQRTFPVFQQPFLPPSAVDTHRGFIRLAHTTPQRIIRRPVVTQNLRKINQLKKRRRIRQGKSRGNNNKPRKNRRKNRRS